MPDRRVRVAIQNVWAHFGQWEERRAVLTEGLRALDPDVVAFIEPIQRRGYDQAVELLGPGYHIVYQAHRDHQGVGAAIASRWPLGASRRLTLTSRRGRRTGSASR